MARPRRNTPGLAARRQDAVRLVETERLSLREAAARVGCNASSVQRWVAAARRGLKSGPAVQKLGRPTRLSDVAEWRLRERLAESPRRRQLAATDVWTTELAVQQLRAAAGYAYTSATAVKLLRKLGYVRVPASRAPDGVKVPAHWIRADARARASPPGR